MYLNANLRTEDPVPHFGTIYHIRILELSIEIQILELKILIQILKARVRILETVSLASGFRLLHNPVPPISKIELLLYSYNRTRGYSGLFLVPNSSNVCVCHSATLLVFYTSIRIALPDA